MGKYDSLEKMTRVIEYCSNGDCGKEIVTMCWRGTGYCCGDCKKIVEGEDHGERALSP